MKSTSINTTNNCIETRMATFPMSAYPAPYLKYTRFRDNLITIVLGISEYSIPGCNLKGAYRDARRMEAFLLNEFKLPRENVHVFTGYVSHDATMNSIKKILDKASETDHLLFYYAGHGTVRKDGKNYLVFSDYEKGTQNLLSMEELNSLIDDCKACLKMKILDCCNSGSANANAKPRSTIDSICGRLDRQFLNDILVVGKGTFSISACGFDQCSYELPLTGGIFTTALLEVLYAAIDKDLFIESIKTYTVDAVAAKAYSLLGDSTIQVPQFSSLGIEGNVII